MTTTEPRRPTREEEAHLEVGVTAVSPRVARALVASFLALCCALPAFELSHVVRGNEAARAPWLRLRQIPADVTARTTSDSASWSNMVAANRAVLEGLHDFEDGLEDEAVLGHLLRPRAQALLTGTLGAGNEQVYVGHDGWLFYRRDVESVTSRGFLQPDVLKRRRTAVNEWTTTPQPDPRIAIRAFHEALAAAGIRLIVVPVPVKPTVHPERLATRAATMPEAPTNPDESRLLQELQSAGIEILDVTSALHRARLSGGATQYLATDTHWRPEAMELVAQLLADRIRGIPDLPAVGNPSYRATPVDVSGRGDIFSMLDLPPGYQRIPEESITVRKISLPDGSPWRSSIDADILVLGDSFSNIYSLESMGWGTAAGFVEQLSFALARPIDRIVQNDAGAYATREILQREGERRLAGKKVVVWQFATRELAFGDWK